MSAGHLRILKNRIRSVESTKKITRAMELVSAAKLKRFQNLLRQSTPYTEALTNLLARLLREESSSSSRPRNDLHPFFRPNGNAGTLFVLVTSDSGLCGTYNSELVQYAISKFGAMRSKNVYLVIGKKGIQALKRAGYTPAAVWSGLTQNTLETIAADLGKSITEGYLNGKFGEVELIISIPDDHSRPRPVSAPLLPFRLDRFSETRSAPAQFLFEPSRRETLDRMAPVYLISQLRMILLKALAAEQSERMNSMHQATKNATEMVDGLILVRNKIRQSIITSEIIEIVSGARAMKQ